MFKLGVGNELGYTRSGMVWGLKGQRSMLGLGLTLTAIRPWFELHECIECITSSYNVLIDQV